MRLSDDRYVRDRRRYDLAVRFIRHEARTRTISRWTGLSEKRVGKLCRDYFRSKWGEGLVRHRGMSPRQTGFFSRTPEIRMHAAILAGFCLMNEVFKPAAGKEVAKMLPGVSRGERLCEAYEIYCEVVDEPKISFERAVLLIEALCRGDEVSLDECSECEALIVVDRLAIDEIRCPHCVDPG